MWNISYNMILKISMRKVNAKNVKELKLNLMENNAEDALILMNKKNAKNVKEPKLNLTESSAKDAPILK